MIKLSSHLQQERADRYAFIVTTVGLGTVAYTFHYASNKYGTPIKLDITSTGVAMVYSEEGTLITLYILRLCEAERYFNGAVPMALEAVIKRNQRRHYDDKQNYIKY